MAKRMPDDVREYFRAQGSKGGKLGGAKSWAKLTKTERSARATKASKAAVAKRAETAKKKAKG